MTSLKSPRGRQAPLVDTHAHVDLYPDPLEVVRHTERAGVLTIAVSNAPSVFCELSKLIEGYSGVRAALGLHPELAVERHRELELFSSLLSRTRYVGEVGLDYQTSVRSERALQRSVFGRIVAECNSAGGKVLTIHSRRAVADVVDTIGPQFNGRWILHWYSGSAAALRRALAFGAYVSVNPAMLLSERAFRVIEEVPSDRLLTESDGPFVSIDGTEGSRHARPADVAMAVAGLAAARGVDDNEMRQLIYSNFSTLLSPN